MAEVSEAISKDELLHEGVVMGDPYTLSAADRGAARLEGGRVRKVKGANKKGRISQRSEIDKIVFC